jgi:hypothetical protein
MKLKTNKLEEKTKKKKLEIKIMTKLKYIYD